MAGDRFYASGRSNVVAAPNRDPRAFQSGIAQGVAEIGGALYGAAQASNKTDDRLAELDYQRRASQETLERSKRLAEINAAFDQRRAELRTNPKAAYAEGHLQGLLDEYGEQIKDVMAGVTTADAEEAIGRQIAAYSASMRSQEGQFEIAYRVKREAEDTEFILNGKYNRLGAVGFGEGATEAWMDLDAFAKERGQRLGPDRAKDFDRDVAAKAILAQFEGAVRLGQLGEARKRLGSDAVKQMLTPDQIDTLGQRITYAENSAAAAERARQAALQQQARQANSTRQAELETGAGTPTDWFELANAQEAAGDKDGAVRSRAKGTEMQAVSAYRDYSLPQMDTRIRELEAVADKTPGQASELSGLRDLRSQSAARLERSGGALEQYAFATGKPIAPINLNDPASLRARAAQATAAAARYGRGKVEPLLDSEAAGLRDLADGSPAEREQAVRVIAAFGDPRAALGAAGQITDQSDGAFRVALTQADRPRVMKAMLAGKSRLAANPKLWDEKRGNAMFNAYASRVLRAAPPDLVEDLRDATKAFFADRASQGGVTAYDDGHYAASIEQVLGSVVDTGRGRMVVPPGRDGAALLRGFNRATGQQIAAVASAPPRWPDGSIVNREQLRDMLPAWVGGTRYAMQKRDGRFLRDAKGGIYTVDLGKLGGQ